MRRLSGLLSWICVILCASVLGLGAANPSDGVSILFLLSEPYGANTGLLWNNFERLGWDVTVAGVSREMRNCSWLTTPIEVDLTVDEIDDLSGYDAVVISPTPGGFQPLPFPAEDLRTSDHALNLIRTADAMGLSLYAGCAGLFVLGDAGVLEGHDVVCHSTARNECLDYGATCTTGSFNQPPRFHDNIVTGTNQRYFALEIPEAIAHSLDRYSGHAVPIDQLTLESIELSASTLDASMPITLARTLGTSSSEGVHAICTVDDSLVVVGYTYSLGRNADLLVSRLDSAGNALWARAFGGPGRELAEDVCVAANGDLIVVGYTTSTGLGLEDAMVVRLTPQGDLVWVETYGGEGADTATGVTWIGENEMAVCGRTESFDASRSDLYILRLDGDGREIWSTMTGGHRYDRAHAIRFREDGSLIVAGGTTSLGSGNYDLYLIALSPDGERTMYKTYGMPQYDIAEDLIVTSDGGILVTGYGDQETRDPNNVLAVKFDAEGTRLWSKRIGERKSFDYGEAVLELEDGTFLICGAMTAPNTGLNDALILHLDAEGKTLATVSFGAEAGNEWAFDLCRLPSGRIAVAGHALPDAAGKQDVLLMILDPDSM